MKNTLKFKLIFWIWGITVILVSLISYTNFKHEANQVKKHLEENALNLASYQAKKIDEQFSKAAVIPVMNAISMENFFNIEDETIVAEYLKEVIEKNDYIYGSCFAFEPNSFEEGKKYFAPYYHFSKVKEGIPEYIVLGDDTYNYFNQDWYRLPRNSENPVWIEPYLDTGVRVFMVTYATRFQLGDKIAGVTTSDISLVQLTDEINNIKLYDTGYAFIVSNKGVLLAYPEYWYELCYSTMKKLKDNNFTEENLKALEPLRNKRYIETELTGELKKLSFNDKEILTILNCAVKIINNLSEINKKYPATTTLTIKMLDQMTIAKEKAISEDIAKNTAVLEERASERFLWYKINEKTINRLKHTIPDDKLTFLKSLLNKSYEKIELNNKLKQAGFNDPNKILDYAEKTEMPWYLINKRIIKNKLTNNIPPEKLKFLEEIINNRVLSTEDLRRELKKLGFKDKTDKTDEITEILEQLKESNSLPLTSNDKNLSILSKKLTEKYEVNVKSINKIRAKKNLVFMLADLGFNDQEITEITDELQTDEDNNFLINEETIYIIKNKLKDKFVFNLNYIKSMKHRTFSEGELNSELRKKGFTEQEISIIKENVEKLYSFLLDSPDPYWKKTSRIYVYPIRNGDFCIGFVYPEDEVMKELYILQQQRIISGITGLLLLLIIIIIVANSITRPVTQLVKFVNKVARGKLDEKISIHTSTYEVLTLGLAFNKMIEDLKKYIEENQKITAEKERIANELNVASRIQMSIIPQKFPAFPERPEIDIYAKIIPALEVGGDFYDFTFIDQDRFGFVIGDAAGKGIPAALFVAISRSFLKATVMNIDKPGECLRLVNELLCSEDYMNMFITMFYGTLNIKTGELLYCNAGHNPPYLIKKNGIIEALKTVNGPALGAFSGVDYDTIKLDMGDGIVLYTDGVTEAFNKDKEIFSDERLQKILENIENFVPEQTVKMVVDDVLNFSEGVPQSDDITVMAVKYLGMQESKKCR